MYKTKGYKLGTGGIASGFGILTYVLFLNLLLVDPKQTHLLDLEQLE